MAWPASGLNSSLADSIESFARNAGRYKQNPDFVVSLDRRFKEIDPELLTRIKNIEKEHSIDIHIYDLDYRKEIKEQLKGIADSEVLDYLLYPAVDGISYGCNKNFNLLLSAGRCLISIDDDIHCRPAQAEAGMGDDLFWSDEYYPGELHCYRNREEVLEGVSEIELDIVGRYRSFFDLADEMSEDGRVFTISPGTYGDSCMASQCPLLNLNDDSRVRIMKNYEELRFSREMVRIPAYNALSRSPQFIMAQSGIDNTRIIPPFINYGRNEDGLLRFLLMLLYPDSLTLFPNFGFLHSPSYPRKADRKSLTVYIPNLSFLLMSAAIYSRPGKDATDIDERFRILGSGIEEIGELPAREFTDAVHSTLSAGLQSYADQLEESLETYNREPELWADDVMVHLESVYSLLREPERMFGEEGCGLSVERAQFHFRNYGRLLSCWPALHRKAASLDLLS